MTVEFVDKAIQEEYDEFLYREDELLTELELVQRRMKQMESLEEKA